MLKKEKIILRVGKILHTTSLVDRLKKAGFRYGFIQLGQSREVDYKKSKTTIKSRFSSYNNKDSRQI